ncbi:MAG TPA: orotate phosphoribosyltransferase [Candidatus Hydrogenedentes bacterium]|nr:MAG: Orotate phosphoribosyltransferase [Candidatus Hydrogenedentes bacterium ADurb.Bin179]HOH28759.1 orotate phosphoribosyltransferase [Candidatus Hydrogenedentota bacterium]
MNADEVIQAFRDAGALLEGHFIYTSGRHGRHFLQAARVMQYPKYTEAFGRALAANFQDAKIDLVVGPATGGITLAYETARHLNCRAAYTEKDGESGMALKRGFALKPGERVLVVEDIITTGGSVAKSVAHLRERGADVAGISVLIDRSGGKVTFDCPYKPLAMLTLESWHEDALPEDLNNTQPLDPDDFMAK